MRRIRRFNPHSDLEVGVTAFRHHRNQRKKGFNPHSDLEVGVTNFRLGCDAVFWFQSALRLGSRSDIIQTVIKFEIRSFNPHSDLEVGVTVPTIF